MTSYAEVIGDPIKHSKSPLIHGYWLSQLGIAAEYHRTQVAASDLPAYLAERRQDSNWRGCNVTMPLKLEALMLADEKSDTAVQAGACNLLLPREGGIVADNSDVGAIMTVVAGLARGRDTEDITLLGTGGAARACLVALKRMGMNRVTIHARNRPEAISLAVQFGLEVEPQPFDAPIQTDALINATPLGMTGARSLELDLSAMGAGGWLFDLVSVPHPTALVRQAEELGLAASGGLTMLVEQAAASFPLFFGKEPPRDAATEAELLALLEAA